MSSMQPGWYPDPFGRFARRYHDGRSWTEHVADQQGTQLSDAAPLAAPTQASAPAAPAASYPQPAAGGGGWQPPGAAPGGAWGQPSGGYAQPGQQAYGQPGQQGWGQTATGYAGAPGAAVTSAGVSGFIGVIVAGVGALLVFIGVLALDWYEETSRSDVADVLDFIDDAGGSPNVLSTTFFKFGWILALLVAIAAVVASLMKPTVLRIVGAALSGLLLLWTLFGWLNFNAYINNDANQRALGFPDVSLGIGGWITIVGFLLLAVGAFIGGKLGGPSSPAPPANRPY
jgi:Protein of unknown function (DUF2510)